MDNDKLKFPFDTDGIEAKALAKMLQDTHNSFREIAWTAFGKETELKIYPFKKGSFEYVAEAATTISALFTAILLYKTAKLNKSTAERNLRKAEIETEKALGEKSDTPKLKNTLELNPKIEIHLNAFLKTASDHSKGFSLTNPEDNRSYVKLSSNEIKRLLEIEESESLKERPQTQTIVKPYETLYLIKVSDKTYGMWEFIYGDIRIMATLPKFFKNDPAYRELRPGTKLIVKLKIKQEFNKAARVWENIGYGIMHIFDYGWPEGE